MDWLPIHWLLLLCMCAALQASSVELKGTLGMPTAPSKPSIVNASTSTLTVIWDREADGGSSDHPVTAYELQYRSMFAADGNESEFWHLAQFNASEPLGFRDPSYVNREVQILSIRADNLIQKGTFELMFEYDGFNELGSRRIITRPISFDASTQELKEALEELETIQKVQVRRCDEANGEGGVDGWLGGCPYASVKGYSWQILFDPPSEMAVDPASGRLVRQTLPPSLPLLSLYRDEIDAPWSGPGNQISIERAGQGVMHASLCGLASCRLTVSNLSPSTPYTFRLRRLNSKGWGPYSALTDFRSTQPYSPPPRPPAPLYHSATHNGVTVRVGGEDPATARLVPPITHFMAQVRQVGQPEWRDLAPVAPTPGLSWTTITADGLSLNASYELRVAARNEAGVSPFSSVSRPMATQMGPTGPPMPQLPAPTLATDPDSVTNDSVRLTWPPLPIEAKQQSKQAWAYDVRYAEARTLAWAELSSVVTVTPSLDQTLVTTLTGLRPYTAYVFGVRARQGRHATGPWSPVSQAIRTLANLGSLQDSLDPRRALSALAEKEVVMEAAMGGRPARVQDVDYVAGAGVGGREGRGGGDGLGVVIYPVQLMGQRAQSRTFFYFRGAPQQYVVPRPPLDVAWPGYVVVKLWGGGAGGGGRGNGTAAAAGEGAVSTGGGGGFAQARIKVQPGEEMTVVVGGGGEGVSGAGGGRAGGNGGGRGGGGGRAGGGGGGRTEVRKGGKVIMVAGGGGGGGATDLCCAHGGGGGGWRAADGVMPVYTLSGEGEVTTLAMGGLGAGNGTGGAAGESKQLGDGHYYNMLVAQGGGTGVPALGVVGGLLTWVSATDGGLGQGGRGADGARGGGGGGGGLWGGGGGGAAANGAGGGGGNGYVDEEEVYAPSGEGSEESPPAPQGVRVLDVSHESVALAWDLPLPGPRGQEVLRYVVERAQGEFGDEFEHLGHTIADATTGYVPRVLLAAGLRPDTVYRFRVRSESRVTSGPFSGAVGVRTLPQPTNVWQRLYPRRLSKSRGGRGINAPVLYAPHNDISVQVRSDGHTSDDISRYADPPSASKPTTPSPRAGHTLVVLDGIVYSYGGRSSGIDCDAAISAPSSLGDRPGGALPLGRCRARGGVLSELWRYDPVTSVWEELSSQGRNGHLPPPREMHSASVVEGRMVVVGGRGVNGSALGDVWEMDPTQRTTVSIHGSLEHGGVIPEGRTTYLTAHADVPDDRCVVSLQVRLEVDHGCTRQLEVTLWGPGPATDDATLRPNNRGQPVRLFAHRDGTPHNCGIGLSATVFDDAAVRGLDQCCPSPFTGSFRPEEPLSAFRGVGVRGQWVLAVSDNRVDGLNGSVTSWGLSMVTEDCVPSYTWTNRTHVIGSTPGPRYRHAAIVVDTSVFVYGGMDDAPLSDLWRLDVDTWNWTKLSTGTSPVAPELTGRSYALSPWGLLGFGGKRAAGGDAYSDRVWLQNMTTGSWELLPTQGRYRATPAHLHRQTGVLLGAPQPALAEDGPMPRYLSAVALVPQLGRRPLTVEGSLTSWPSMGSSNGANVSLVMFGGHDGLQHRDDLFELQLNGLATRLTEVERKRACDWRLLDSTGLSTWKGSCHTAMSTSAQTGKCNVSEILLQAWCRQTYQALSSIPV